MLRDRQERGWGWGQSHPPPPSSGFLSLSPTPPISPSLLLPREVGNMILSLLCKQAKSESPPLG